LAKQLSGKSSAEWFLRTLRKPQWKQSSGKKSQADFKVWVIDEDDLGSDLIAFRDSPTHINNSASENHDAR